MKNLIPTAAGIFLLTIFACSDENTASSGSNAPTSGMLSFFSEDGLFEVRIGRGEYDRSFALMIEKRTERPADAAMLSAAYRVTVDPAGAQPVAPFDAEVRFQLPQSDPGVPMAIGQGETVATGIDRVLSGQEDTGWFVASTDAMTFFTLLDESAYLQCQCDTAASCDAGCGFCDPDCATCGCNVTDAVCDVECSCDPDCGLCACDTGLKCQSGCSCDEACNTCACDTDFTCTSGCSCDVECAPTDPTYPYVFCSDASDCLPGFTCIDNACLAACASDADCLGGTDYLCDGGFCLYRCDGSAGSCDGVLACCVGGSCAPPNTCGS